MKFSTVLVLYLSATIAPSALAVPLRYGDYCPPGGASVRCIEHSDDHPHPLNASFNGGNTSPIHARQLSQTLTSILQGLPIIGPLLAPILGSLLGAIGLSEVDVTSASNGSLNAEQIATLANFEFALSNAAHKVLSSGNPQGDVQSKLKTRGAFPLGELVTSVPMIGSFLRPIVPLLEALGLDSVDATPNSVYSMALLTEDQSAKLSQLRSFLRQEVEKVFPNASNPTPSDAPSPSKASPDDTKVSPTPPPDTSEDDGSDSDTPSPEDASPADEPVATPVSSPAPK